LVLSGALSLADMGALAVSAGILAVVVGVGSADAGVAAVVVGVGSGDAGVPAVAVAQCSEIIFSPVTTTLLSEEPELVATVAFCAMTSTSWPRCGFRSIVLLVILKL
jgi:hypothetical protein